MPKFLRKLVSILSVNQLLFRNHNIRALFRGQMTEVVSKFTSLLPLPRTSCLCSSSIKIQPPLSGNSICMASTGSQTLINMLIIIQIFTEITQKTTSLSNAKKYSLIRLPRKFSDQEILLLLNLLQDHHLRKNMNGTHCTKN